jgi:hypothetical protein
MLASRTRVLVVIENKTSLIDVAIARRRNRLSGGAMTVVVRIAHKPFRSTHDSHAIRSVIASAV